jgi:hypothetical protein
MAGYQYTVAVRSGTGTSRPARARDRFPCFPGPLDSDARSRWSAIERKHDGAADGNLRY